MEHYYRILVSATLLFLLSCKKDDAKEKIPAYVYIQNVNLVTSYSSEGTASHHITDVWIYVDDNPVGVFELPCLVPVLHEGKHKLAIYPGMMADGISDTRRKYPFYQPFVIDSHDFIPGEIDTLKGAKQPVVNYYPLTQITIWKSGDFEDPGVIFEQDPSSDTSINRIINPPQDIFEGVASGQMALSASQSYLRVVTNQNFVFPVSGQPVYMELNYKANNSFAAGLVSEYTGNTIIQENTIINTTYVNGQLAWKKIYIELTQLVGFNSGANTFEVFFRMTKDSGVTEPVVQIDNVKLVYGQ